MWKQNEMEKAETATGLAGLNQDNQQCSSYPPSLNAVSFVLVKI